MTAPHKSMNTSNPSVMDTLTALLSVADDEVSAPAPSGPEAETADAPLPAMPFEMQPTLPRVKAVSAPPRGEAQDRSAIAAVGLGAAEARQLLEAFGHLAGAIHLIATPRRLLRLFEDGEAPLALVLRCGSSVEAASLIEVLRVSHPAMPVVVLCDTQLEAAHLNRQEELGPMTALVGPLGAGVLLLLRMLIRADSCPRRALEARGVVNERGLAQLLFDLYTRRVTGVLRLKRGTSRRSLYLLNGEPTWAESNLLDENFGRFLLVHGVINEVEYRWSQRIQNREGVRQGEALLKIGVLDPRRLDALLREQILMKFINAFGAGSSEYSFEEDVTWLWRSDLYAFSLMEILSRGLWRTTPSAELQERWESLMGQHLLVQLHAEGSYALSTQGLSLRLESRTAQVVAIKDLFEEATPLRQRLATLDALQATFQAELCDRELATFSVLRAESAQEQEEQAPVEGRAGDPRRILGVGAQASAEEITRAYQARRRVLMARAAGGDASVVSRFKQELAQLELARHALLGGEGSNAAPRLDHERRANAIRAEEHYHEGLTLLDEERYEEALSAFQRAHGGNPEEPLYLLYEGWTLASMHAYQSEQWQQGKKLIHEALAANPTSAVCYEFAARIDLAEGREHEGRELLRIAARLNPESASVRRMLEPLEVEATTPPHLYC